MSTDALTKKDYKSDQEVRWCPGCGDYAILNSVQGAMAELGLKREKTVIVSGIGCSSRFPYYVGTYGFHSIHGRAAAIASGVKVANPDLSVWIVTGDGDGLSIGGNHMIHLLRRNLDVNVLLFNNEIYGLTKGQYSPTSPRGLKTKSSPVGSLDNPFNPLSLALGAAATFVARTVDTNPKHMTRIFKEAAAHKGTSFIEIWQNCVIFNDGAHKQWTDKKTRDDSTVDLVPGEPIVFGPGHEKGLKVECCETKVVDSADATVWQADNPSPAPAFLLAQMDLNPDLPRPIGIFRSVPAPTFEDGVHQQIAAVREQKGTPGIEDLVHTPDAWTVG